MALGTVLNHLVGLLRGLSGGFNYGYQQIIKTGGVMYLIKENKMYIKPCQRAPCLK
jgi:hypothetical protein